MITDDEKLDVVIKGTIIMALMKSHGIWPDRTTVAALRLVAKLAPASAEVNKEILMQEAEFQLTQVDYESTVS